MKSDLMNFNCRKKKIINENDLRNGLSRNLTFTINEPLIGILYCSNAAFCVEINRFLKNFIGLLNFTMKFKKYYISFVYISII